MILPPEDDPELPEEEELPGGVTPVPKGPPIHPDDGGHGPPPPPPPPH
jgi:hypothetical protein